MNCTNLKQLLLTTLEDVHMDPTLALELDSTLKNQQDEAKANGNFYTLAPPSFKLYKTKIIYRCNKEIVSTDVIGIKCKTTKAKLLKEFFSQLASLAKNKLASSF